MLDRVRDQVAGQRIGEAAKNNTESKVLADLLKHAKTAWKKHSNRLPNDSEMRSFLSSIEVREMAVETGQMAESHAKSLLAVSVLVDDADVDSAWTALWSKTIRSAKNRSGADRKALEQLLTEDGKRLQAPISYRADIESIKAYTRSTLDALDDLSKLEIGSGSLKITRPSTETLAQRAKEGPTIVVGLPGAGKSGAVHDVAKKLLAGGNDVVVLAADRLIASTPSHLEMELRINRPLPECSITGPASYLAISSLTRLTPPVRTRRIAPCGS